MKIKDLKVSTATCIVLIAFSAAYFIQSLDYNYWQGYGPGAGFAPRWCSGIMLALLIICLIQSFRTEGLKLSEAFPKGIGRVNIIICWTGLIFFAALSKSLGFMITSTAMLSVLFGRSTKWYKALIYSLIVSFCCFALFKWLLKVPVPVNKLGW